MPQVLPAVPRPNNLGDLLDRLGVPASRVCLDPPPGKATKRDLLRMDARRGKLCELIEGTLVEKPLGTPEAFLASELGYWICVYVHEFDSGFVCGTTNLVELAPNLVRSPDVSFVSWARRPERTVPRDAISKLIPHLVVEVLSPSNTRKEMIRKRGEYFRAGVEVVWEIDPEDCSAEIFLADGSQEVVPESGTLLGGTVLPGFELKLAKLFEKLEKPKAKERKK